MNKQDSYSVIGRWTEPDGKEDWDVIHKGPISYDEAVQIARDTGKRWRENASPEYKNLPHSEIPIKYEALQKMIKSED